MARLLRRPLLTAGVPGMNALFGHPGRGYRSLASDPRALRCNAVCHGGYVAAILPGDAHLGD